MQLMLGRNPFIKYLLSAVFGLVLLGASQANAQSWSGPTMTQLELIQFLVQLSGDSLDPSSTPGDYVNWAQTQGLMPAGGWSTDMTLTRDVLAQVLVQFFNFKVKKGGDPITTLKREGIILTGTSPDAAIIRSDFVAMVDEFGFQPRAYVIHSQKKSPNRPPAGGKNPPKGNGWGWYGIAPGQGQGNGWGHINN